MKVKEILETMDYGKPRRPKASIEWIENGAKFGLYINGKSNIPDGRESFKTHNPATGESRHDCRVNSRRCGSCLKAPGQHRQTGKELVSARAKFLAQLHAWYRNTHASRLSKHWTMENPFGKAGILIFPWLPGISSFYAGAAQLMEEMPDHRAHGVVGQVIPEFPLAMMAGRLLLLAMGNTG